MEQTTEQEIKADPRIELESLSTMDYERLIQRLGIFAEALVQRRHMVWQGVLGGNLPKGLTAEDLVVEAITRVIAETRRSWNKSRYPTLERYLRSVIRSIVGHLATSSDNRLMSKRINAPESEEDLPDLIEEYPCPKPSPNEIVAASEFWMKFTEGLEDELQLLCMALEDGVVKRAELAVLLEKTPREIDNMGKKLERRLRDFCTRENMPVPKKGIK